MEKYTYELFNLRNTETRKGKNVKCRIYNLDETQIEVFDLMITEEGEYLAWTGDVTNEATLNRRKEIEKELNQAISSKAVNTVQSNEIITNESSNTIESKKDKQITLHSNEFTHTGSHDGYDYTSLRVKSFSNSRIYFTAINNQMKLCTVTKQMKCENGKVFVSFGKNDKLIIGSYTDDSIVLDEVIEQPIEQVTNEEDTSEVITLTSNKSLHGYGVGVHIYDNRNTNNTMTYFNHYGNESFTIRIHHTDYDKYWEVQDFIYSIMKEHGKQPNFWTILGNKLNEQYGLYNTITPDKQHKLKQTKQPKEDTKINEVIPQLNMIASYAKLIYTGDKVDVTFSNDTESNTITFKRIKSWSHRKYVDKIINESNIKLTYDFRYGWEILSA